TSPRELSNPGGSFVVSGALLGLDLRADLLPPLLIGVGLGQASERLAGHRLLLVVQVHAHGAVAGSGVAAAGAGDAIAVRVGGLPTAPADLEHRRRVSRPLAERGQSDLGVLHVAVL